MVVDCGGGTVDITVHKLIQPDGSLQELHKATGGSCGSLGKVLNSCQFKMNSPLNGDFTVTIFKGNINYIDSYKYHIKIEFKKYN